MLALILTNVFIIRAIPFNIKNNLNFYQLEESYLLYLYAYKTVYQVLIFINKN